MALCRRTRVAYAEALRDERGSGGTSVVGA
jgi:hypothetical protein